MFTRLRDDIIVCTRCPRLVAHRQRVASEKRLQSRGETYWGRPLPGFGDPRARLVIVGLAPAAHGGNRTGRMFTGDSSGEWLARALYESHFSNQPLSAHRGDGLVLEDAYITAAVRCAPPNNKPTAEELAACRPYLQRELALLTRTRVVVALGKIGFEAYLTVCREAGIDVPRPRPAFGHARTHRLPNGITLIASYHPSRQNTQTGKLTAAMLSRVFRSARRVLDHTATGTRSSR